MIQSKRYFFIILVLLSHQICISQVHANSNSDRVDYLIELLKEPLDEESQEEIKGAIMRIWKISKSEESLLNKYIGRAKANSQEVLANCEQIKVDQLIKEETSVDSL